MTTTIHTIKAANLDPITLVIDDIEPGRGHIIVKCWDCAWTCYWGSTGEPRVADFLKHVNANYVANCLISGRRQWTTNKRREGHEFNYLERIAQAIVDAAKGGQL